MFFPSSFSPTTSNCQLAKLTFLENPSPWEEEKYIYCGNQGRVRLPQSQDPRPLARSLCSWGSGDGKVPLRLRWPLLGCKVIQYMGVKYKLLQIF